MCNIALFKLSKNFYMFDVKDSFFMLCDFQCYWKLFAVLLMFRFFFAFITAIRTFIECN